jgi:hypothetical protein
MKDELISILEVVVAYSMYYRGICLEELRRTQNHLSQGSWCPVRNSNAAPPKYKFVNHQLKFSQGEHEV